MTPTTTEHAADGRDQRQHPRDMQRDEATGEPVAIVPDGEKKNTDSDGAAPNERLRIDPESRIPRPVQPDLA